MERCGRCAREITAEDAVTFQCACGGQKCGGSLCSDCWEDFGLCEGEPPGELRLTKDGWKRW